MQAELVSVGTELLLGQIVDTNATYIAQQLKDIGLNLYFKTTVGDNKARIATVLKMALDRSDIIITSGGIGPTLDDLTREVVAEVLGRELVFHQHLLDQIESRFARRGIPMAPNNARQAYIPDGAIIVENPRGTAPSFIAQGPKGTIISLPGVPGEMRFLMETAVIPYLKKRLGITSLIKYRVLRFCNISESRVDEELKDLIEESENPTIGLLAQMTLGEIHVRLTAKAKDHGEADQMIDELEAKIRNRLGNYLFGVDDQTLEWRVGSLLQKIGATIAVAEGTTGGALSQRLASVPGSEGWFKEGIIAANDEAKVRRLGIPKEMIEQFGSLSPQIAEAMAEGVRELSKADFGLSLLSGQDTDPTDPEAGTVTYVALARPNGTTCYDYHFTRSFQINLNRISMLALDEVRKQLELVM
ncbi:MAG: competence/damage-inducible protein A [Candidatus Tectomicrobia bacterium]|nr:competence/damage-inducible protein A [Candidatus Tectomicrobia bacterium]